jgi:sRNA-binding regulator protein Hfq
MKNLLFVLSLFISVAAFSQNDKIYMHNGETIEGTVVRVAEFTLIFKYANEDAEQTVGKYAVEKIVYGKSGREEKITDKISVLSKDDWEKVVMLVDKSEVAGLTKVNEVKGKTAMINYRTAAGSSAKAEKDLKQKAAEEGCPFVLMTSDKDADLSGHNGRGLGGTQSMKTAFAYKY